MKEKKIATANWMAETYYGLVSNKEYVLEKNYYCYGVWSVYDFEGNETPTFTVEEPQKKATETNIDWMAHNKKVLENLKNKKKD